MSRPLGPPVELTSMDNLFSHADDAIPGTAESRDSLDPVICTVTVPGPVAQAFAGFTDHTHLWWPLESHGVYGAGSYVEFEENLILETADDGRTTIWGTIDDWQPPLSFPFMASGNHGTVVHGVACGLQGRCGGDRGPPGARRLGGR